MVASNKAFTQSVNFIYSCMTGMNEIRKIEARIWIDDKLFAKYWGWKRATTPIPMPEPLYNVW